MSKKKVSYEENIKRLEEIADKIEAGELDLESTIHLFEEGTRLATECHEYLNEAELKVNKLIGDSGDATKDFSPE